jgi:hypothetical protein
MPRWWKDGTSAEKTGIKIRINKILAFAKLGHKKRSTILNGRCTEFVKYPVKKSNTFKTLAAFFSECSNQR